ncbi:MAG TPA: phosphoribosylanthranilate isomerase, partial [Candidatus Omnitrophota bacterium]|nr:phosphoribosylanthranilate isomerase [Candidatus Omnitrophota bacterium]
MGLEKRSRQSKKENRIKICGITNLEDALFAQGSGADALGFVFYPASPRYIRPEDARKIILRLNKKIIKVGVFVNPEAGQVKRIARLCQLDILQFHGDEAPDFCHKFPSCKIIKAFRVKDKSSLSRLSDYRGAVDYYLFDAFSQKCLGGTGRKFNWGLLKMAKIDKPFFLSGGLTPKNVVGAIKTVCPAWVDVSSGVEKYPGQKDQKKIKNFIDRVMSIPLPLP